MLEAAISASAHNPSQLLILVAPRVSRAPSSRLFSGARVGNLEPGLASVHPEQSRRTCGCLCVPKHSRFALALLLFFAAASLCGHAQSPPPTPATQSTNTPKTTAQQVQPVTTTVVVHGEVKDDYLPES